MAFGIGLFDVCSLAQEEQGGIRALVAQGTQQGRSSFLVRHVDLGAMPEEVVQNLLIALCRGEMQRCLGNIVRQIGIRSVL